MAFYGPMGSMPRMTPNTRAGGDERERERPEHPREETPPEGPESPPGEPGPVIPPPPGTEAPGPEEPGPGPEPPPAPTAPPMPEVPPFEQPGDPTAMAPYRTPAFFTNRFVGGAQQQRRFGAGTPVSATPASAQLDPEMLQRLVERFQGGMLPPFTPRPPVQPTRRVPVTPTR
jgi:hypothetical protein